MKVLGVEEGQDVESTSASLLKLLRIMLNVGQSRIGLWGRQMGIYSGAW